jgi:hypothetical protein
MCPAPPMALRCHRRVGNPPGGFPPADVRSPALLLGWWWGEMDTALAHLPWRRRLLLSTPLLASSPSRGARHPWLAPTFVAIRQPDIVGKVALSDARLVPRGGGFGRITPSSLPSGAAPASAILGGTSSPPGGRYRPCRWPTRGERRAPAPAHSRHPFDLGHSARELRSQYVF